MGYSTLANLAYDEAMDADVAKKVEAFFLAYPQRSYPKDQIIVFGGESPDKIFYLASGKVANYDISYRGDQIDINIFKAPSFFPMSWAINRTPNRYFFKAEETSVVHVAPPDEVVAFIKKNPDVMYDLLSRLYRGVDGILERVVHLMGGSARSRLMYELLIESRRFGKKVSDNVVALSINEGDLAARSGLARETVSREMRHLKDKAMVEIVDGTITIRDLRELEKQLGQTA